MSDLCHNCGDCHLGSNPMPCPQPLNECIICRNYGHTYNFCPLSVRVIDKNYQYWMLCHNCDRWHLPRPCGFSLVTCPKCHHVGHLPAFCPLLPAARVPPLGDSTTQGRQQPHSTTYSRDSGALTGSAEAHTQLNSSTVPPNPYMPPISSTTGQHQGAASFGLATMSSLYDNVHGQHHQKQPRQNAEMQTFPTPMPSSAIKSTSLATGEDPFVDSVPRDQSSVPHDPYGTQSLGNAAVEPETAESGEKSKPVRKPLSKATPCYACKKAKKRCRHLQTDAMNSTLTAAEVGEAETAKTTVKRLKLTVSNDTAGQDHEYVQTMAAGAGQESQDSTVLQDSGRKDANNTHQGNGAVSHGSDVTSGWLQQPGDNSMQSFLPAINTNANATNATQSHNLPPLSDAMAASILSNYNNNTGTYMAHSHQTTPFANSGNVTHQSQSVVLGDSRPIDDQSYGMAQAGFRRGGDVFTFDDTSRIASFRENKQDMNVHSVTESPSGQIQYEQASPAVTDTPAETVSTAKPKKVASKKKGGGRKQKK